MDLLSRDLSSGCSSSEKFQYSFSMILSTILRKLTPQIFQQNLLHQARVHDFSRKRMKKVTQDSSCELLKSICKKKLSFFLWYRYIAIINGFCSVLIFFLSGAYLIFHAFTYCAFSTLWTFYSLSCHMISLVFSQLNLIKWHFFSYTYTMWGCA